METVGASLKGCGGLAEDVSLDQGTPVLGGSRVVTSGVISPLRWDIRI